MAAAPELVPFAGRVVLRRLIWPFTALCGLMFAWGLLNALDAFVRACFGTAAGAIGWIPYAGRVLSTGLSGIEHKISSILGRWASYFEVQAGIRWHGLGQVVSQLAADVEAAALMDFMIVKRLSHFLVAAQVHLLLKGLHAIGKVLVQRTTIVEQKVIRVEKVATNTIGAHVMPRLGAFEGELGHVIEWDIPRLRARTRAVADRVGHLEKQVAKDARRWGATAFAGAVAVALARLGLGWVRCTNARKFFNKRGCNAWNELDSLLVGAALLELPYTLELLAEVGREVIKDGSELIKEFR